MLLAAVVAGHASTVILDATGLPGAFENGTYGSSGATYNGFVTSTINGVPNQMIICDDFSHTTQVPSGNMVYDFSTLGGVGQLQNARFTGPNMTANYDEAAVLLWELSNYVSTNGSHASADTITDYQYSIWNIFDPYNSFSNPQGVKVNSNQTALQTAAVNMVDTQPAMLSADVYQDVRIYTPDPNGGSTGSQEFLQFSTPEPGSLLMVIAGAALIGAAGAARRRSSKRPV
jgi:hypothetical protein